ncbi:MAG: Nif3-like dinuclear metal center hexameric protein [Sedimentisphaerales bacterium]|nr:Nif3-like dinuclear metal center hexameric protein [Sedimentisphaerales bacterium]
MKVKEIAHKIEEIIPLKLAQDWDNVGLLIGDAQKDVRNILLTIDVTHNVAAEAKKLKTDLIVSYHPVIWDGLKKVTAEGPTGVVYDLIHSGIAVFSIHTALDSAVGGVNDGLAEIIGIVNSKPIGDYVANPAGDNYKLVIFVPIKSAAKVSNAVFAAGAGAIGNYSHCGFGAEGTGTFLPHEGAKPAIGRKGKIEKVEEIRFETIVPAGKLNEVVTAMLKAHPYETPAFDIFKLHDTEMPFGLGRFGELAKPVRIPQIIKRIKKVTGAKAVGLIGDQNRLVRRAAVCAGTCGTIINLVIAEKADLYLTGELKHHQALAAQEAGLSCICLSHTVSERFILKNFAKQLQKQIKTVKISISKKDADPFHWKNI